MVKGMSRLSNKVAIVTGESKGIGGGIATALGAAGARVAVNYSSDREGAERVAQAITDNGGEAISVGGPTCPRPQMSRGYSKKSILPSEDWTFRAGGQHHSRSSGYRDRRQAGFRRSLMTALHGPRCREPSSDASGRHGPAGFLLRLHHLGQEPCPRGRKANG